MTEYMTLKTAMKYLGIGNYGTLREYIKQGLPVIKVGRSKRISKTTLYKWRKLGLPYSSIEGMNVYNKEQVNQWLLEHKQPKARS